MTAPGSKRTPARKACDKAAGACDRAWRALSDLSEHVPDSAADRHLRWLRDLREYGEYLERCTWPDKEDR